MNKLALSIISVFIVFGSLLAYQASQDGTSVVLKPSELLALDTDQPVKRIRVAGRVTDESIDYQVEPDIKLAFSIRDPGTESGQSLSVVYGSLKPDMFASGRDVIIDGEFSNGTLIAANLLTQCPSKYEPPSVGGEQSSSQGGEQGGAYGG